MFLELAEEGNKIKREFHLLTEDEQRKRIRSWSQKCTNAMKKKLPKSTFTSYFLKLAGESRYIDDNALDRLLFVIQGLEAAEEHSDREQDVG
ncbi:hypothetical protein H1S01_15810 [Heliobacterium chlorum]|uniref:Uncharacterized protein n=1 Tax=Heliobacterium chlorum TaxID=2698 RepID=A0ABR7T893_HELCL|nr:hypothetical protein [Heliobacterium chlorum]MBC9785951.1 hypothetical protein [Heliobacterium chlorum]